MLRKVNPAPRVLTLNLYCRPLGGLLVTWKVSVGFSCAILAAFLTFPGFRYAKMHLDALADYQHSAIMM